ncbi:MAG: hypothetical protein KKB22_06260 [Candidatus Omnitrophica bacterium]|nr:hypothetical protein [Candidatus Omnitrophota bacterium]
MMILKDKSSVVSDFFLDSAKITFGSLVIGIFTPGVIIKTPLSTFLNGLVISIIFLTLAVKLEKTNSNKL